MNKSALKDLNLSGVRWELTESPWKSEHLHSPVQQTFQTNPIKSEKTLETPRKFLEIPRKI